mmetsp:Transcript_2033/g.6268  ORF Transcript_2033/g.6268 Transcript_2033/m.6268 type:complete len:129 (+) Transcript_2033:96-482(+)|eukprot:CAMPEP_0202084384 /NCGR_PEP_ID=MMETSP0964-20121228/27536_1 /ASSEMBLY_ACC=CAM_ASM_000500 /TAXON_ID=4773 /ORGANISM="Schizochytrium aggregatum, Strain ATCC28209" /LENGTH=128 /DNA_ID=CAMNT_0048652153 /DNA_START=74 /DNA_END=460 /DNA_ORIENTATION=+
MDLARIEADLLRRSPAERRGAGPAFEEWAPRHGAGACPGLAEVARGVDVVVRAPGAAAHDAALPAEGQQRVEAHRSCASPRSRYTGGLIAVVQAFEETRDPNEPLSPQNVREFMLRNPPDFGSPTAAF